VAGEEGGDWNVVQNNGAYKFSMFCGFACAAAVDSRS